MSFFKALVLVAPIGAGYVTLCEVRGQLRTVLCCLCGKLARKGVTIMMVFVGDRHTYSCLTVVYLPVLKSKPVF